MKTQVVAAALLMVVIVGLAGAEAEADAETHPGYGNYYYGYRDAHRRNVFGDYGFYDRDKREAKTEPADKAEAEIDTGDDGPREHQLFKRAAEAEADASFERGYGWYYPYKYHGNPYYRYLWK